MTIPPFIPPSVIDRLIDAVESLNQSLAELSKIHQPDESLTNEEVCEILHIVPDTLRRRISKGVFVEGFHYTGTRGDRLWSKSRITRYLETRHDKSLQENDLKQWHKQLKKSKKS
jgi:hypothetical protein